MREAFETFCETVCAQVKHATEDEKREIAQELSDHLSDHAAALVEIGRSEEEAAAAAVAAMGNAAEIGKELNKEYPLLWLILSRAAALLIAVLLIQALMLPWGIYNAATNLRARMRPPRDSFAQDMDDSWTVVDYRYDAPCNDVYYIYSVDILPNTQKSGSSGLHSILDDYDYYVRVAACNYDRNPFGNASQVLLNHIILTNGDGVSWGNSSGHGSSGAHHEVSNIPVNYGEESLHLDCSAFGWELHELIPLNWEGVE